MLVMTPDDTEGIAAEVRTQLEGRVVAGVVVRAVDVARKEDPFGVDAWYVLLSLDPPSGSEWDVETTRTLRDEARRVMDAVAYEHGSLPDGVTSVAVTAFEPDELDVAPPDTPDPQEDPAFTGESDG